MNAYLILGLLLLIVPGQILLNYFLHSGEYGAEVQKTSAPSIRTRLSTALHQIESGLTYYGTYEHFKELFLVPYQPKKTPLKEKFRKMVYRDPNSGNEVVTVHFLNDNHNDDRKDTKSSSKIKDRKSGKYFHKNTGTSNSQSFRESSSSTNGAPPPMQDSTCVAEEVNEFNEKNVFFARSDAPRDWRPPHIQYKVGEVVTHVSDGYHGIIVGWDYECKAPDKWLKKYGYFNNKEKKRLLHSPHYLVLVEPKDTMDKTVSLFYIPQEHLIRETELQIESKEIDQYFHYYSLSTHKYIPKEWLKKRYPRDS